MSKNIWLNYSVLGGKMRKTGKSAELERIPNNTKDLPLDKAKSILNLAEKFEEDDDVQNVFHNLEITDELIASLE